ncbi:MAG: hypothetical protein H7X80_03675, partial [bacterium]|nr:hypothetical protein [Candidatus Kapabacteria bacterium]
MLVVAMVVLALAMSVSFIMFAEQSALRFIVLIPFVLIGLVAWTFSA